MGDDSLVCGCVQVPWVDGGRGCFEAVVTDVSHSVCTVGTELRSSARALHYPCIYLSLVGTELRSSASTLHYLCICLSHYGALDSPELTVAQVELELTKIHLPFHPKSWD